MDLSVFWEQGVVWRLHSAEKHLHPGLLAPGTHQEGHWPQSKKYTSSSPSGVANKAPKGNTDPRAKSNQRDSLQLTPDYR